ncbi:GDYXXLXY domain-containing protein [Marinigracilibium pacificum]|uniref:GDYXXLXY domain-containing protein n=1 Tax=Marinigracilibium pacificum TaxID=2729599 RepID=A0A848J025_9BACT|nr:GDYXXLXY domain-containing protein [Marinigracilibium pacificum]NMM47900.1 GDYXXLXY domain-containing protein [Marinigracilibium pacificum]
MTKNKIIFIIFIIVALIQLYVPASMIIDREKVLEKGVVLKIKTRPIDPTDPFRGKYIDLRYEANSIEVDSTESWIYGTDIYVVMKPDSDGFSIPAEVSKTKPDTDSPYFKAKVDGYYHYDGPPKIDIIYPFDRFYMEESKAYEAELAYRDAQWDTSQVSYAIVKVLDGQAVLQDVIIGDESIKKIVEERLIQNKK